MTKKEEKMAICITYCVGEKIYNYSLAFQHCHIINLIAHKFVNAQ